MNQTLNKMETKTVKKLTLQQKLATHFGVKISEGAIEVKVYAAQGIRDHLLQYLPKLKENCSDWAALHKVEIKKLEEQEIEIAREYQITMNLTKSKGAKNRLTKDIIEVRNKFMKDLTLLNRFAGKKQNRDRRYEDVCIFS